MAILTICICFPPGHCTAGRLEPTFSLQSAILMIQFVMLDGRGCHQIAFICGVQFTKIGGATLKHLSSSHKGFIVKG